MPNNDAELRIGGNADELRQITEKAAADIKRMSDQMQGSLQTLNAGFQKIHGTFMAFTAVLAGGAAFRGVINASAEWTSQAGALSKSLGISTEQASVMNVALVHLGIESDIVVNASQKMAKQMHSNAQAFEKLGVDLKDASGQFRPAAELMGEVNQKLAEIKNPIEQAIAGQQLYGESWNEVRAILRLTTEQMAAAETRAKELHLIVGADGVAKTKQYKEQMRDLTLVGKSLEVQFGNAVMPTFVKLGQFMSQEAPAMGNMFKTMLEGVGFAASATGLALKDMGDAIGALAAQTAALLSRDMDAFRAIGKMRDEEYAKNEAAYERLKADFGKPLPASAIAAPNFDGPTYNFEKDKKTGTGSQKTEASRMSAWETELNEAKVYFQKTYDLREYSKTQELDYWQSILRLNKVTGQERIGITNKISALELDLMKKQAQQRSALEAETINAREKSAEDGLRMEEMLSQREFELGNINKQQLLALQEQYENRRFEIAQEAQAQRIEALLGDPNMDPVALAKLLDQMAEIQRRHALSSAKIQTDMVIESRTQWSQTLAPISSAFEKSVTGMIMQTTTLRKATSNIFQSILGEFVSMCVKMGVQWAAMELTKSAATKSGTIVRALLEKAGLLEVAGTESTKAAATIAAKKIEAAGVIPAEAAIAAGGAASAVAAIPVVGPGMAAGAYAETMAMVMSGLAVASASGGYDIPAGVNPVTQLHAEEMVLPAHLANPLRESLGSGGLSGGLPTIHITAMDSRDVQRALKQGGALHKAILELDRMGIKR